MQADLIIHHWSRLQAQATSEYECLTWLHYWVSLDSEKSDYTDYINRIIKEAISGGPTAWATWQRSTYTQQFPALSIHTHHSTLPIQILYSHYYHEVMEHAELAITVWHHNKKNWGAQFLWIGQRFCRNNFCSWREPKHGRLALWDTTRDCRYRVVNKTAGESFSIEAILCSYHLGDCQANISFKNGKQSQTMLCSTYQLLFIGEL